MQPAAQRCYQWYADAPARRAGRLGRRPKHTFDGPRSITPTGVEVVVPVSSILSFGLELKRLEVLRTFRTAVEKWQLSSEDHARILKLASTTVDDEVAAAVANVSGRS